MILRRPDEALARARRDAVHRHAAFERKAQMAEIILVLGPVPRPLGATVGVLVAPVVGWDAASLGLGVPLHVSGDVLNFHVDNHLTTLGAARSIPLLAFLPVLAAGVLVGGTALARRTRLAATVLGMVGLSMLMRLASTASFDREVPGARERAAVEPALLAALLVPVGWGIVVWWLLSYHATRRELPR